MSSIFIVDNHPIMRLAIRILMEHEGHHIVGETDNGVDALQMVRECMPDLIILDICIPKLDGLELLYRFSALSTSLRTLVLTAQPPALFASRCMRGGSSGYLSKAQELSDVLGAIKAILGGYNYFPSQTLVSTPAEHSSPLELALFRSLNDRELIVLQLFAQGRTNKEIATGMFLSNKTVSTYKKRIMQKLDLQSMADLIEMAKRNVLL